MTTNVTRYSRTVVGLVLALCLFCFSAAFAQQQMDAATKEDIEQLLEITEARHNMQVMWDSMAQQAANMAADSYQRKHPNASPLEIRKAAELAGECTQRTIKAFSIDELFEVMIPVYQRHLTRSDVRTEIEFYGSPTGQKMIKEMPAIMSEAMQAAQPILQKHLPELEAQAEAAAAEASKQSGSEPRRRIQNIQPEEMWARVTKCVLPTYPEQALTSQITGAVDIGVCVSPKGEVTNYRLLSGHPLLVNAAVSAIHQWKFQPNPGPGVAMCSRVRALVLFNADGTTAVALAHAILADDFGDPGLPNVSPVGPTGNSPVPVPRPVSAPECQVAIQAAEVPTGDVPQTGIKPTSNDVKLEDSLKQNPDDLTARSALITCYFRALTASKTPDPDIEQKREQHILWLIEHHPDAEFAGSPEARIELRGKYGSAEGYQRGKQLWLQQVDSRPDDARILDNAATFFLMEDPKLERQVLKNALALEPSDNQTLSLLARSYELERIGVQSPEENAALAKKALSLRELGMGNAEPAQRFHALGQLATDAFDAGDTAKAGQYASELLQSAPEFTSDWSYGNAIHTGNIVLGRVALQHGDIPVAERCLLAAGKTPGSPQLDSFGPNMLLAKELLERGQRDVVVAYLQSCAGFWKMGGDPLQLWISTVKAGGIPDFGACLVY